MKLGNRQVILKGNGHRQIAPKAKKALKNVARKRENLTQAVLSSALLTVSLSILAGCSPGGLSDQALSIDPQGTNKILLGEEVVAGDPMQAFVVSLEQKDASGTYDAMCTGSLIAPRVILTAAHCVDAGVGKPSPEVRVRFHVPEGGYRQAVKIIRHPLWDIFAGLPAEQGAPPWQTLQLGFDIGLILLEADAPVGTNPLTILDFDPAEKETTSFWVAGFGVSVMEVIEFRGKRYMHSRGSGTFRKGLIDRNLNSDFPGDFASAQDSTTSQGVCYGDSGGPALVEKDGVWGQIGITSFVDHAAGAACRGSGYFVGLGAAEDPFGMPQSFLDEVQWQPKTKRTEWIRSEMLSLLQ